MSGVISKAIKVLDILVPHGTEKDLSVSDISKELDIPVQTVHRLLSSLARHGLVSQNRESKKYRLGLSLMKYGFLMWDSLMLRSVSRPYMLELSNKTKETVYLANRENAQGVYIDCIDSPQILKISEPIGLRLPLYIGASNRVILAYLPQTLQESLLQNVDWEHTPCLTSLTYSFIKQDIARIRQQGYSVTIGEATEGTTGIAAPIFNYENIVIGSLNIAGPSFRFSQDVIQKYSVPLRKYSQLISKELGFRNDLRPKTK